MSEKDINDRTENSGQDAGAFDDLADFVDLEDLSSLLGEDSDKLSDLTELGDISDLPDISDLSESAEDVSAPEAGEDLMSSLAGLAESSQEESATSVMAAPEAGEDLMSSLAELTESSQEESAASVMAAPEAGEDLMSSLAGLAEGVLAPGDEDSTGGTAPAQNMTVPHREDEGEDALDAVVGGFLDQLDASASKKEQKDTKQTTEDLPEEGEALLDLEDVLALDEKDGAQPEDEMQALYGSLSEDLQQDIGAQPEEKRPGLLKRLFGNIITDEIAQEERASREKEKEAAAAKAAAAETARAAKQEAKKEKAEKKAAEKKAQKEEKDLKKAAKAEERAHKKAERAARLAEEAAQEELEVTGKLNRVGVSIVVILTVMFLTTEISGTLIHGYQSALKDAQGYFEMKKYTEAYEEILGTDIREKDQETYDRIITVMKVQREIDSYENYTNMKYYPDALNALLLGLKKYDQNIETARALEIDRNLDGCREKILGFLQEDYGVSEAQAKKLLAMDKEAYTKRVIEISMKDQ